LVSNKNKPFVEKLQQIVADKISFEEKLKKYCVELIKFMQDNYIIWQVLLFEMTVNSSGWKLQYVEKTNSYRILQKWGEPPTEEEVAQAQRYYEIIHTEMDALIKILHEGVEKEILKTTRDAQIWASNVFFGIIMSLFQWLDIDDNGAKKEENIENNVNLLIDRFMYGNAL